MVPIPGSAQSTRLRFLDVARGATMFFVLLSHFGSVYFRAPEHDVWRTALIRLGMVATPTFVILSGVLIGVLYQRCGSGFAHIQARLIDRGLFLVLIGHTVISLALSSVLEVPLWSYSTDAIGAAMVLGALVVPRVSGRSRLVLSLAAYLASWLPIYLWIPEAPGGEAIKEVVFGSLTPLTFRAGAFPLVPWVAVYLASSVFGERLASLHERGAARQMARELAALGVGGVAGMAAIKLAALQLGISPLMGNVTSALLRVGQKSPPAPLYLMFYGGLGMLLILGCLMLETRGWCRRALRCAEVCGEVSLFVFIAHFYVFWLGIYKLGPGGPGLGLVYFALSVTALVIAAQVWHRGEYNRVFTVGYEVGHRRFAPAAAFFANLAGEPKVQAPARS